MSKDSDDSFLPRLIFWETTNRCNLSCLHCRASAIKGPSPEELTTAQMKRFIDDVAGFAKPILVLSGGEPLVRPDIFEIAEYSVKRGLRVALATNGTLIDDAVAQKIKEAGIMRVSISLDGADAVTHDSFRGEKGAFDKALAGSRRLKKFGVGLQINTTVTKRNVTQLPQIYKLAIKEGADAFHIFMLVPVGCGLQLKDSDMLTPEKYEEVLNWYYDREQEGKIELKATCAPHYYRIRLQRAAAEGKKLGMAKGCLAGSAVCFVSHKGDVQPCGYLPLIAGNVRKEHFKDIWEKSSLFANLRNPNLLKGKCGACEYKMICEGCRARAFAATADYLAEEPFCMYQPLKLKIESEVNYGSKR